VSLNWTPSHVGVHNLTVFVDCNDAVQESNENNNKLTKRMGNAYPTTKRFLLPVPLAAHTYFTKQLDKTHYPHKL
ncbi:MAG: hypothetical protein B6D65_05310, partial [candidate division Zixibacteria bacterium 4484_93]